MKNFLIILALLFTTNLFAVNSPYEKLIPVGTVITFIGTTCPTGFIAPNGSQVNKLTYPALCSLVGTIYGSGTATTCALPDYRGRFLRGIDGGSGNDPDSASRTAMNTGGATGNNVGSIQTDSLQGHRHYIDPTNGTFRYLTMQTIANPSTPLTSGSYGNYSTNTVGDTVTDGTNGTPRVSSETRVKNAYVNYCIKY